MSLFSSKRERECGTVFESSRNFPKLGEYSRVWLKTENLCRWKEIHYIKDALPDIGSNIQHSDSTILVFMDPCEVAPGVEAPVILWPENETLLGSHLAVACHRDSSIRQTAAPFQETVRSHVPSPRLITLQGGGGSCRFNPSDDTSHRRRVHHQVSIPGLPGTESLTVQ